MSDVSDPVVSITVSEYGIRGEPVEDEQVDLTTVEMLSAFGLVWIWTEVTPEQAQDVYKMLGEPQVTRQVGEAESVGQEAGQEGGGVGQVVSGEVVEDTGGDSTAGDKAVDN